MVPLNSGYAQRYGYRIAADCCYCLRPQVFLLCTSFRCTEGNILLFSFNTSTAPRYRYRCRYVSDIPHRSITSSIKLTIIYKYIPLYYSTIFDIFIFYIILYPLYCISVMSASDLVTVTLVLVSGLARGTEHPSFSLRFLDVFIHIPIGEEISISVPRESQAPSYLPLEQYQNLIELKALFSAMSFQVNAIMVLQLLVNKSLVLRALVTDIEYQYFDRLSPKTRKTIVAGTQFDPTPFNSDSFENIFEKFSVKYLL